MGIQTYMRIQRNLVDKNEDKPISVWAGNDFKENAASFGAFFSSLRLFFCFTLNWISKDAERT